MHHKCNKALNDGGKFRHCLIDVDDITEFPKPVKFRRFNMKKTLHLSYTCLRFGELPLAA